MRIRVHYHIDYLNNDGITIIEGEPRVVEIELRDTVEIKPERPTIWLGNLDITDSVFSGEEMTPERLGASFSPPQPNPRGGTRGVQPNVEPKPYPPARAFPPEPPERT